MKPTKTGIVSKLLVALMGLIWCVSCAGFGDQEKQCQALDDTEVARPNFEEHITFVMDFYCNKCHTTSPSNGAPSDFRLDICDANGDKVGAQAKAARIVARMNASTMPPSTEAAQPCQEEKDLVVKWLDDGAPCDAQSQGVFTDAGDPEDEGALTPFFEDKILPILQTNHCSESGCHDSTTQTAGLNIASEASVISKTTPCDPEDSVLIQRLRSDTTDFVMPLGFDPLFEEDVKTLEAWIQGDVCSSGEKVHE